MNKAELIEALADKTGLQKQEAKKVLDAYIEIVTERMSENEEIVLVGFGTLIPRPQTQRLARNPKTGTPVMIPARKSRKTKCDSCEKRNAIFFAKTKCTPKIPVTIFSVKLSGRNTSVVQTPFENYLNDTFY